MAVQTKSQQCGQGLDFHQGVDDVERKTNEYILPCKMEKAAGQLAPLMPFQPAISPGRGGPSPC
eukprot:3472166-Ditylum_brightwellii.AAC.1